MTFYNCDACKSLCGSKFRQKYLDGHTNQSSVQLQFTMQKKIQKKWKTIHMEETDKINEYQKNILRQK